MNRKIFYTIISILTISLSSYSQELLWKAGFSGFIDNREYYNEYAPAQTIVGARTFMEGGFALDENNEFGAGFDYMYEFGSKTGVKYLKPILYYRYNSEATELYMGSFHRKDLVSLPLVLQSDTFNYYKANIEGIYLSYRKPWGSHNIWLDWTSRQTLQNRETFLIGATGYVSKGIGFIKYDLLMYHYAGTADEESTLIRDNGGYVGIIGANLSDLTVFDSLSISSGITSSYDRLRTVYKLKYNYGSISEFFTKYKSFSIRSTLYFGDGQNLMVGDKMYQSPIYNRTDLMLNIIKQGRVNGCFEFSFHFIPTTTDYSQRFTIYIDISGRKEI